MKEGIEVFEMDWATFIVWFVIGYAGTVLVIRLFKKPKKPNPVYDPPEKAIIG